MTPRRRAGRLSRIACPLRVLTARRHSWWQRTCLAWVAALLLPAAWTGAQPAAAPTPVTWEFVVDAYLEGRLDEAARLIELSGDEAARQARLALDAWMAQARELGDSGPRARDIRRDIVRRVQASAVLPLEVLVRVSSRAPVSESLAPLEQVAGDAWERLADFEDLRLDLPGDSQRRAREQVRDRLQRFRGRWQVAYVQFLVNAGRHQQADQLIARVRLRPGEAGAQAELWFLKGLIEEFAGRMADNATARSTSWSTMPTSRLRGFRTRMDEAHRAYRRALEAVPGHEEARLHLGRVELERKRPSEAIRALANLRVTPCRTEFCGLAWLFTGESHEATGNWGAASAAYAQASTVQALRQSALVGLIQLALRRDNSTQAFDLTTQFTEASPLAALERPDAWSDYLTGRRADADAVLVPLREALLP